MKISVSVQVEQEIALVWQAWNDPDCILLWNAASEDWHTTRSRVELVVGGRFCHHMAAKDGSVGFDFEGTFTDIDAPHLLRYRMDDGRQVTVLFVDEQGSTRITEEFDAESEHSGEQQRAGWQSILNRFKHYVESAA